MKTTVEIADDVALTLKAQLRKHGVTMRVALDEAIRQWIETKDESRDQSRIDPSIGVFEGGNGLSNEFAGKGWDSIRDAAYGEEV